MVRKELLDRELLGEFSDKGRRNLGRAYGTSSMQRIKASLKLVNKGGAGTATWGLGDLRPSGSRKGPSRRGHEVCSDIHSKFFEQISRLLTGRHGLSFVGVMLPPALTSCLEESYIEH